MDKETLRKEVWLTEDVIDTLQELADKRKWSLKTFMEQVLIREADRADKKKKKTA